MEDEAFIEAVRRFECLWKVTSRVYRDLRAKENAWKAVADEVGEGSAEVCQKRWKGLRDKFVREAKKKKTKSGQEGPIVVSSWPLFQTMSFLLDTVRHRMTTTNFTTGSSNLSAPSTRSSAPSTESQEEPMEPLEPLEPLESEAEVEEPLSLDVSVDTPTNVRSHTPSTIASLSASPSPQPQKRCKTLQVMDDMEKELVSSIRKISSEPPVDKDTHFGNHVASTLRELPEKEKALAKIEIDKILFHFKFSYPPPSQPMLPPCTNSQYYDHEF